MIGPLRWRLSLHVPEKFGLGTCPAMFGCANATMYRNDIKASVFSSRIIYVRHVVAAGIGTELRLEYDSHYGDRAHVGVIEVHLLECSECAVKDFQIIRATVKKCRTQLMPAL
jgi:hypothetical protein